MYSMKDKSKDEACYFSFLKSLSLFLFLIFFLEVGGLGAKEPPALYLTWTKDPTTTMTILWHTPPEESTNEIYYKAKGETVWKKTEGENALLEPYSLLVHTTELTHLLPDTDYLFKIGKEEEEYLFRTLPQTLSRDVTFAVGGDAYMQLYLFRKMNRAIAKKSPEFVVLGGDIAYTVGNITPFKGENWKLRRWQTFFAEWKEAMVTPEGRLIPLLIALGNHDVKTPHSKMHEGDLLLYTLFPLPRDLSSYYALTFGDYLNLFILDTGHRSRVYGQQTEWLKTTLANTPLTPYRMAVYHVSAYPSCYSFTGSIPTQIREHWLPFLDHYHFQAAFENHNHAFKRTHRIKNGALDPEGILFLGDGSWGVNPRSPRTPSNTWYIAKASSTNAFWLNKLTSEKASFTAIDIKGKVIDQVDAQPVNR